MEKVRQNYLCQKCQAENNVNYERQNVGKTIKVSCAMCNHMQHLELYAENVLRLKYYNKQFDPVFVAIKKEKMVISSKLYEEKGSDTHVYLDLEGIEKNHCLISKIKNNENQGYFIVDFNSNSGVFKNNEKLVPKKTYKIEMNDIIKLGPQRFLIQ